MRTCSISLKGFFALIVGSITLLALVIIATFKFYWFDPHIETEARQRQLQVAQALARQVSTYLSVPLSQLRFVAAQVGNSPAAGNLNNQRLNAQLVASDVLESIYVIDSGGKLGALALPADQEGRRAELKNSDWSFSPVFMSTQKSRKVVWSDVFFSIIGRGFSIGIALDLKGHILVGEISLDKLKQQLGSPALGGEHVVMILDRYGQVLFDQKGEYSDRQLNISNIPMIDEGIISGKVVSGELNLSGREMLGVLSPIENTNWFIVYAEPVAVAYSTSRYISSATSLFLLLSIILGSVFVLGVSNGIAGRFSRLAKWASAVADGGAKPLPFAFSEKIVVEEFAQLSASIQQTAGLLADREREILDLMSNLPGVVYRKRLDSCCDDGFLSEECLKLTGFSSAELQPDNLSAMRRLIHPEDAEFVDAQIRHAASKNKPWQIVYRIVARSGDVKWVCDYGCCIHDHSTDNAYCEGFIADITDKKIIEEAHAESQSYLRAILGSTYLTFAVVDKHGVYLICEGKGLYQLGIDSETIVGQSLLERYKNVPEIRSDFLRCLAGESIHSQTNVYDRWYEIIYEPIVEANGDISGVTIVSVDISQRKIFENKLLRLSSLLKGTQSLARVGAWELDLLTNELSWSDETYRIFEVDPEEFFPTTENALSFYTPESRLKIASVIQKSIDTGKRHDHALSLVTAKGNRRDVQVSCEVVEEQGKTLRLIGAIQDITEYKQIENELRSHKLHLEDLVEQRTLEMVLARDAAEQATQAKSEFLANTSHEIRTPINAVIGLTRMALKTDLSPKQKNYLEKIYVSASLLLGLINDILDFSKIEAGRLELAHSEFDLADVLEQVSTVTAQRAYEKNIEYLQYIDPAINHLLVGDSMRLAQILINLCGNAVKFTEQGEIILSVELLPSTLPGQICLQFSVKDSGIGMSARDVERLFQPFNQIDSSNTRRYGGTGLGLAISRQLVEMMGGYIWVESELGQGSEFKFTSCFSIGTEMSLPPRRTATLQGLKAMVVDESSASCTIHTALLTSFGYDVQSANSLGDALKVLEMQEERPFDFVLLDIKVLPQDEERLDALRQKIESLALRVIVMTPGMQAEPPRSVLALSDTWVSKPVMASQLFNSIMSAFGKAPPASARPVVNCALDDETCRVLSGRRVLLVEDNEFNQEVACELLAEAGITVTVATNGQEAIDLVLAQDFDLVLMDIQMPVMDGFSATGRLRQEARLHALPIVAMTAHAMVDEQHKCLDAGMNDFLCKPVDPDSLYKTLVKWIKPIPELSGATADLALNRGHGNACPLPARIAGISIEDGLRYCGGKPDFYLKMLRQFRRTKSTLADEIREQLDKGDRDAARRIAHTSKSIAAHIGAASLASAASSLEKTLIAQDDGAVAEGLNEFSRSLTAVLDGLQTALDGLPISASTESPLIDNMPEQLQKLAELLSCDIGKALRLERQIRPCFESGFLAREYAVFRKHLKAFDTSAAAEALNVLIAAHMAEAGVS